MPTLSRPRFRKVCAVPRNSRRKSQQNTENGAKLLTLGAAFTLAPMVLESSPIGRAMAPLVWLGLLMLVVGGLLVWAGKHPEALDVHSRPLNPPRRSRSSPPSHVRGPGDRTATELQRGAAPATDKIPTRPTCWGSNVFDVIEWRRFEALVEDLFRQGGFETKSQSHGPDGGVDVWVYSRNMPGEAVSIIQCKHWKRRVGVDKVRELRGVMAAEKVARGQFVTTSTFTPDAIEFGRANSINLLDASGLLALIARRTPEQQKALLRVALEGDYWRPTCVNCGVKMHERSSSKSRGPFWGCANYPKCRNTMNVRGAQG